MEKKFNREVFTLFLGGITLILFSTKPYILDLIEPSKSLGQIIGENAKDILDNLNGENDGSSNNSRRDLWSNIITILSFILFSATLMLASLSLQKSKTKWYGVIAILLSLLGLIIYLTHLTLGVVAFIVLAILVVGVVIFVEA